MNRWRRLRFAAGALAAALLIAAAVAMGLAQLLLPLAARYPQRIAALLSDRLHRPVSFQAIRGEWQASGPLFAVSRLTLGAGPDGTAITLPEAELKFDFGAWLKPHKRWIELRLSGLDLELRRDPQGAWHVAGFGGGEEQGRRASLTSLPADLLVRDLSLTLADQKAGTRYVFLADVLRLTNAGGDVRAAGRLHRNGAAGSLRFALRMRPDMRGGELYAGGTDVDLAALLGGVDLHGYAVKGGRGQVEAWTDWRDGRVTRATARLDLVALDIVNPDGARARAGALRGVFGAQRLAQGWRLAYAAPSTRETDGGVAVLDVADGTPRRFALGARALDVSGLAPLAALLPHASPALSDWLAAAAPHGRIAQARLRWDGPQAFEVEAQLDGVGFAPSGALPGIDRLAGTLRGDAAALSLELPAQSTVFRYPHVFRKPFVMAKLAGTAVVWSDADGTHLGSDAMAFEGEGFGGQARGEIVLQGDGTRPFLDLYAVATHGDVPAAKLFWPVNVMPPTAVAWLDRALVAGRLTTAHVLVRGDLDDWPFPAHTGRFQALGEIEDATLDYSEGWPRAEGIAATADFVNAGMVVQARAAETLGNRVSAASAVIPDLADAELTLAVEGSGKAANLLEFVRRSPIGARYGDALKGLRLNGGSGRLGFTLVLPVAHAEQFALDGQVQLADADLTAKDWNLHLDKINGPLAFDAGGFSASALTARFHDAPTRLALAVGSDTADPAHQLEARMQGHFGVAQLVEGYPQLAKLPQIAHGDSDFDIGLVIPTAPTLDAATPRLQVRSDLVGVNVDLPAPLDKTAADALPLDLRLELPVAGHAFTVALGDVLRARARMTADPNAWPAVNVALGTAMPAEAPASGVHIGGHAQRFDLSGWAKLAMAGQDQGPGGNPLQGADFTTADARVFGRSFHALAVKLAFEPAQTTLTLAGDAVAGTLSIPAQDLARRGITARFDRLHWPEEASVAAAPASGVAATPAAAASVAPATGSSVGAPPATDTLAGVAPAAVPPLHFWVGDLRLGKSSLGEARFESYPTAAGMHVEQLDTRSPSVQLHASGDWVGNATVSRSGFTLDFYADDLGKMLDAFGYAGVFSGGETQAHIVAGWPGAPTAFDLARLDGVLKVAVKNGRIPEVSPGVGRLFGLFSIRELPRRLTLDFGDIFRQGFSFNTIDGEVTFKDGSAWTQRLQIKGPAADITVSGRTGLKAKDYDQTVVVIPHVGGTLPVVGAIAGGPVGAAAGLAVQGLLGKGLNKAAAARYHIGGSWEKPQITLVAKGAEVRPEEKPSENKNVP